jgi:hypothetical protein
MNVPADAEMRPKHPFNESRPQGLPVFSLHKLAFFSERIYCDGTEARASVHERLEGRVDSEGHGFSFIRQDDYWPLAGQGMV